MKIAGIIAEYNPFHKGHEHQISETRKKYKVDYIVVVTSGHFVQRGEPALLDKWTRTRLALLGGADLVLELPTLYATSSSKNFAYGAVSLFDALGIVNYLSFGSELGSLEPLRKLSHYLCNEPLEFKQALSRELKLGASYPLARSRALSSLYPDSVDFLKGSNNILALEYLNALYELKSSIEPITIPRVGAAYLSNDIHESIPSASAIRTYLTACQENPLPLLQKAIPPTVYEHFEKDLIHGFYPLFPKDLYPVLCYLLQSTSEKEVEACYDFPLHLFRRLKQQLKNSHRYEDLIENSMSRNYTKTTVQRSLIHLLLHLSKEKADEAIRNHYHSYIRVLGFKKEAAHLLHKIKETSALPLVTNVKDRLPGLNSYAQEVLHNEIYYTNLYQQFVQNKYGVNLKDEYRRELVIL